MIDETETTMPSRARPPRGVAMAGLAVAMFLVVLDSAMVNLAGATIREDLALSATGLTVVVSSYLVAFAGLLLLGGRLADVLGGRRVFMAGMAVYLAASVVCATAPDGTVLTAGRIGQGIGAAALMPAALSLVLALYPSPAERTRAVGLWGAVAGAGSLVGVFLGGTLTDLLGWESVFWAPVPFGIAGAIVVWVSTPATPGRPGPFDLVGAVTITLGIAAVTFGTSTASEAGWGSPGAIGGLSVGLASLAAFVIAERRSAHPLVPLGVFRRRPVVAANLMVLLVGGTLTSMFFFLPQYQQEVLGMSPLATGMSQLPIAAMIIVGSVAAPVLSKRLGLAHAQPISLAVLLAGILWLAVDPTDAGFSVSLAGAFTLIGAGLGLALVGATTMGVRDSGGGESGLLSGLINASQQVGGAVGLAVVAGIAIRAAGAGGDIAYTTAFLGQAGLIGIALALSLVPSSNARTAAVAAAR
ncbi:MFS transporter [Glycomyces salinus]|uniref:MFS transporter n=1 Tax=Glycomyces salinus TaxID=980294 RepID=UPI0018EACA41|nr:MFS transporter [Glycomyces salinus]